MDTLKYLGRSDMPQGEFWLGLKHDEPEVNIQFKKDTPLVSSGLPGSVTIQTL